jgi:predicted DCC family thiol-disulfide oxidoreductase YuxK
MQMYDSWVVINELGQQFTTFQAGVEIAKHSPILQYLVPLAKPQLMQKIGEWMYRKIAKNRARIPLP